VGDGDRNGCGKSHGETKMQSLARRVASPFGLRSGLRQSGGSLRDRLERPEAKEGAEEVPSTSRQRTSAAKAAFKMGHLRHG
jgi:hypothetical protein